MDPLSDSNQPETTNCSYPNCEEVAEYICKCSLPNTLLCINHHKEHITSKDLEHKIESAWIEPSQETKKKILMLLESEKENYKIIKTKALDLFFHNVENASKIVKDNIEILNKEICDIDKMCFKIMKNEKISKLENDDFLKSLILDSQNALKNVKLFLLNKAKITEDSFLGDFTIELSNLLIDFIKKKLERLNIEKYENIDEILCEYNQMDEKEAKDKFGLVKIKLEQVDSKFITSIKDLETQIKKNANYCKDLQSSLDGLAKRINKNFRELNSIAIISKINEKLKDISNYELKVEDLAKNYLLDFNETLRSIDKQRQLKSDFERDSKIFSSLDIQQSDDKSLRNLMKFSEGIRFIYAKYTEKCNNISSKLELIISQCVDDIKYIYGILDDNEHQALLCIYDTENQRLNKIPIFTMEPLSSCILIIQLPNSELFCYGNSHHYDSFVSEDQSYESGFSCILDLKTYSLKKVLPEGRECMRAGGIFYNQFVFVFGALNNGIALKLAEKFDLVENKWIELPPLPVEMYQTSCVIYDGEIWICGLSARLIKYDIEKSTYSTTLLPMEKENAKIIFIASSHIYIIEQSGIFQWTSNWSQVLRFNIDLKGNIFTIASEFLLFISKNDLKGKINYYKFESKFRRLTECKVNK
ncbi:unnamed protein product [Blepharisma stoltei]|uniref:Uncharacterized protein n=1 Tax=Blepharisma stoltei TaxID=1481888 RepID=A0AAU9JVT1_9CILI|nr:unnamed protein product [Blepharisma stoltei]